MPAAQLIADIVVANHILFDQGVVDAFGHVSVRSDENKQHYFLARNMAPSLVEAGDVLEYDFDSNAINPGDRRGYLERFIHSEIYRMRPDVMSVVHSHSPAVIPFSVSRTTLQPVYHMAGFLRDVKKYDIRTASGQMTDMLIRNHDLGVSLAAALGSAPVALMRGHGITIVGTSIKEAVCRSVYAEMNARIQIQAMGLGTPVEYLSREEAELAEKANAGQFDRPWELWQKHAEEIRRGK